MKARSTLLALGLGMATFAVAAAPSLGAKGGTDVLHFTLRTDFVGTGAGELVAMLRQQGNADVQKLRIDVSGLLAEANYHLILVPRDPLELPVDVMTFGTDEDGEASLKLMHLGNGKKSFPVGLDTLSDVGSFEIQDDSTAVVLEADLIDPDSLQYQVKRRLTNDGFDTDAEGALFMKEQGSKTLFRLRATNLDPDTDYTLAINGVDVETFTSDADGELEIDGLPATSPLPYDMTLLELVDTLDDMSVLSTELP